MKFRKLKIWRFFSSSYGDPNKEENSEILPDSVGPRMQQSIEGEHSNTILFVIMVIEWYYFLSKWFAIF